MGRKEKNTFPSIDEIKNEIYEFIDSVGADERFKSKLFKFLQGLENEAVNYKRSVNLSVKRTDEMKSTFYRRNAHEGRFSKMSMHELARLRPIARAKLRRLEKRQKIKRAEKEIVEFAKHIYKDIPADRLKQLIVRQRYNNTISNSGLERSKELMTLTDIYHKICQYINESRNDLNRDKINMEREKSKFEHEMLRILDVAQKGKTESYNELVGAHEAIKSNDELTAEIITNSKYKEKTINASIYYRALKRNNYSISCEGKLPGGKVSLYEYCFTRESKKNSTDGITKIDGETITIFSEIKPKVLQQELRKLDFDKIKILFDEHFKIFRNCIGKPHMYITDKLFRDIFRNPLRYMESSPEYEGNSTEYHERENIYDQMVRKYYGEQMKRNYRTNGRECLPKFRLMENPYYGDLSACKIGNEYSYTMVGRGIISDNVPVEEQDYLSWFEKNGFYFVERSIDGRRNNGIIRVNPTIGDDVDKIGAKIAKAEREERGVIKDHDPHIL